jgi:hypothetical protein
MINFIQRNTFLTTIFAGLIILTALWLPDFLTPRASPSHALTQPLQAWLLSANWLSGISGLWVNLGLTVLTAALLFLSNQKHLFVNANGRLMLLLYLILVSALPKSLYYPEAQMAATALVLGLYCLFQTYQKKTALTQLFLSAMWISIAGLFYFPAIAVLFTVIINILITRQFNWREWTAILTGFLLPYFYFGLYLFWTEDTIIPLWQSVQQNFQPLSLPITAHNLYEYIFVITLVVVIIWVFLIQEHKGALNKVRIVHLRQTNNWLLVCILISVVIFRPPYGSIMPLLAIPLSVILANADNRLWRKKVYIFFLLLLLTAIIGSRTV